ncbi:unnamed protein product [Euphydryas editha]|uniref:DDE-1 domain-containing protein n=1 Tax=Euphydryas editha TaxID=104508 RepID=A0AAU9TRW2_EUPED|nr:unnamed protein product [Euphydryas editha]
MIGFSLLFYEESKNRGYIGDNSSSHISVSVLQACHDNDIRFVCLPPNSQFFRPVKIAWRNILANWKASTQGSREKVVQKSSFPVLLTKLLADLEENCEQNLKTGFKKCRIHPIDVMTLLERLPHPINKDVVQDSLLETLEAKRVE